MEQQNMEQKDMAFNKWVEETLSSKYKDSHLKMVSEFWKEFYGYANELASNQTTEAVKAADNCFKESVIGLLVSFRLDHPVKNGRVVATPEELVQLQLQIENLTMHFDEENIYKSCPDILKMLMDANKECAKDYLLSKLDSKEDQKLLNELGLYTLEALIVHVLCLLFSSCDGDIMIRLATMIEQLEVNTRMHVNILRQRKLMKAKKADVSAGQSKAVVSAGQSKAEVSAGQSKAEVSAGQSKAEVPAGQSQDSGWKTRLAKSYTIGTALVEFMEARGLVNISLHCSSDSKVTNKKKESYYREKNLFVICNFDISLLPLKLNMPMVCPPVEWTIANANGKAESLSDITGGYLSNHTSAMYDRYSLLSSTNIHHFYLELKEPKKLCEIMSSLQSHPLEINNDFRVFLDINHDSFVERGMLSPKFVANLNVQDCTSKLRELYMGNPYIKEKFTYNDMLQTLEKDIQKARYEKLILELADAYAGYQFYLPAFLDFRGRIYRCGVLHFHERDLSRSLIRFAYDGMPDQYVAEDATCFHFRSFNSYNEASHWYKDALVPKVRRDMSLFPNSEIFKYPTECTKELTKDLAVIANYAKHPFQFLSSFLSVYFDCFPSNGLPITQDASASAYQIMSYFLLDERMATYTNLIPSPTAGKIFDIYTNIKDELHEYIFINIQDKALSSTLIEVMDRKVVKSIFMPIIYGKTIMSTAQDLKASLSRYLTNKECFGIV